MNRSEYYWLNKASEHHQQRMLELGDHLTLTDIEPGKSDGRYMMFRRHTLTPPDGGRKYEFLIEYDVYNPSQGIYLGCKSITFPAFSHTLQIKAAIEDWEHLRPYILQRLNNVFIDKDFTHRFRDTDNAHNGTFWPFWISLYEDEDPRDVGCRVLDTIYSVYREYFSDHLSASVPPVAPVKKIKVKTAFTHEAYAELEMKVKKICCRASGKEDSGIRGWEIIESFFTSAEKAGLIQRMEGYERAWCMASRFGDVDFNFMA